MHSFPWCVLVLGGLALVSCSTGYGPPMPVRPDWEHAATPPPELQVPTPRPRLPFEDILPSSKEWDTWKAAPKCVWRGKGKSRRCVKPSVIEQAKQGALIRPTLRHTAGSNSALVTYTLDANPRYKKIYEVPCAVKSPCYLQLPAGEQLVSPLALNVSDTDPESWDVGETAVVGQRGERQQVIALRPRSPGMVVFNALYFRSGLTIFLKLVAVEDGGMLAVTWDVPPPPEPEIPLLERPPKINVDRLYGHYQIALKGKITPPWMPTNVIDDGAKTFIRFAEPLTSMRAPGVFGLNQRGKPTLISFHMFLPAQPHGSPAAAGAVMVIHGLHPALELIDNAGLTVRIVREPVPQEALSRVQQQTQARVSKSRTRPKRRAVPADPRPPAPVVPESSAPPLFNVRGTGAFVTPRLVGHGAPAGSR